MYIRKRMGSSILPWMTDILNALGDEMGPSISTC